MRGSIVQQPIDRHNFVKIFMREAVLLARAREKDDHRLAIRKEEIKAKEAKTLVLRADRFKAIARGIAELICASICTAIFCYLLPYVLCGILTCLSMPISFMYISIHAHEKDILERVGNFYATKLSLVINAIILDLGPLMPEHVYVVWNATAKFVL